MNTKETNYTELLEIAVMYRDQMKGTHAEKSVAFIMVDSAINNAKYYELLQAVEMYRDYLHQTDPPEYYTKADNAIKNYYSLNLCPHRLKYIKTISTGGGCETTVEVCHDCGAILSSPITDC